MKITVRSFLLSLLFTVASQAATLTVISIADSGPGSLRQAIANANNGDLITFDPILTSKTVTLTSGELLINKSITITGLGTGNIAVSGTSTTRVFNVASGATATLSAFTITGGNQTTGGGIVNFGTLTLDTINLTNNTATQGGAVYNSNGVLTVLNSTISGNSAGAGGAIANQGSVTVTNALLVGNTATFGGGLYSTNGTVTIAASTFSGNNANAGGAIYNDVGNTMSLNASNSVTANFAVGGGGLYNEGTLTVSASTVVSNNASDGGGLYNSSSLTLVSARFVGNSADRGAGLFSTNGAVTVTNSVFSGNSAGALGGAVYNDLNNNLNLSATTLTGNHAGGAGGGLANFSLAQIDTSTFTNNSTGAQGGGLYALNATTVVASSLFVNNNAGAVGGGIDNDTGSQLTVVISTFVGNDAGATGGALENAGTLTLAESTLAGNVANTGGLNNDGAATVDNTIFAGNTGNLGGTVVSKGFNLSDDNSGTASLSANGDQNNTAAGLDPLGLQDNGGPTLTIALAAGSPAIAAGGPVYAPFEPIAGGGMAVYPPFTDQRGQARFVCGKMDIGAYQTQTTTPPTITLVGASVVTNECGSPYVDPGATAASTCGAALSVTGGGMDSLALQQDGTVIGWGDDTFGQIDIPATLTDPVAIAAGLTHSLGLRSDGTVIAWGSDANGQIDVPASATNEVGISAGGFHSLAVDQSGAVIGWGDDTFGQIDIPASVTNAVAVAAGRYHSLALLGNGTVVGWGGGTFTAVPEDGVNYGQAEVPAGLSNIIAIATGAYHSLALRNDGLVFAWGGGTTNLSPFVDFGQALVPAGLSNVVAIAAGGFHSLALGADGSIVAWGNNTYGQTNVPPLPQGATAVAGGTYHSLAITSEGTVLGWGSNSNGQAVVTSPQIAADLTSQITVTTNAVSGTNGVSVLTQTYSVTDTHSGSNSVLRTVVTMDTTPPVPNPLPTITNTCSVTLTAGVALDACAGVITGVALDPTTYTTLGTYAVRWTYTDPAGNVATQIQMAVVLPSPLVATVNPLMTVTGTCSASVTAPTATNDCGTVTGVTTDATTYVTLGTHIVHWTYADTAGNGLTQLQTVVINRISPPTIQCPGSIATTNTTGQCGAYVYFNTPVVTPYCPSATLTELSGLASGSLFPIGVTTNLFQVTDADGASAQCSFTVTVTDTEPPKINCPSAPIIISTATNSCVSAPVTYPVTATDNCPGLNVTFDPPTGTVFPVGTNSVTCTAVDAAGNSNTCVFTVIIEDLVGPVMTCPADIVTNAVTAAGTPVTLPTVIATDGCTTATVLLSAPSGSVFPPGVSPVTVTAYDSAGNQTICTFQVNVWSPRTLLQSAYDQSAALPGSVTGSSNLKQVSKAINSMHAALDAANWSGDLHANSKGGKKVFSNSGKAANTLLALSRRTDTGVSAEQWQALAQLLTDSARSLAVIQINDAGNVGGNAKQIDSANQNVARGDASGSSQANRAIQSYSKAWQGGLKALP